jgi:hypothetical protein
MSVKVTTFFGARVLQIGLRQKMHEAILKLINNQENLEILAITI